MGRTALWRGSTVVTERKDSPEWTFGTAKDTCVRVFEGPYAKCLTEAKRLVAGTRMADLPLDGFFVVEGVKVKREPGNKGVITIPLEYNHPRIPQSLKPGEKETPPVYEIEWTPVEKKLVTHPVFLPAAEGRSAGTYALTIEDLCDLAAWEKEDDFRLKAEFKYANTDKATAAVTQKELSVNAKRCAEKMLRGTDSYTMRAPVVKQTFETSVCPSSTECDLRMDLSFIPARLRRKYIFVQTADRGTKTGDHGRWQRTKEFTGSTAVDDDLYPPTRGLA